MTDESKEIIKRLKECIEKSGLTYIELEKKTGIAKSSLQRYANGVTKKIPVDSIQTIAKAIGVAPEYILGWDNSPKPDKTNKPYKFSNVLRSLRLKAGLNQEELGKKLGLSKSTISMYESGTREPNLEILEAIANIFNVDMNTLLGKETQLSSKVADSSNGFKIHTSEEKTLLNNYNALNQTGKEKLIDYSDDLVSNGKYTEKEIK